MKEKRRTNLERSIFFSAVTIAASGWLFRESSGHQTLLLLAFIIIQQLAMIFAAAMLMLRLLRIYRKKYSFTYQFAGTFQIFLAMTDLLFLLLIHNMTRISLLLFLSLNVMTGTIIFTDIYRNNRREKKPTA